MLEGADSSWGPAVAIGALAVLAVLRVRWGRVTDFDRTPVQRWGVRIIDALAITAIVVVLLAVVAFAVLAVLSIPWSDLVDRIGGRGGWPLVLIAIVVFGVVLGLTPQWFRPAHLRAMRDDEPQADDAGGRRQNSPLFDGSGRTYPDGSELDPRDRR